MRTVRNKQKGAVLIEAAYVLPVIIGVLLFVVEAVAYAMNSFAANDVLTDVHSVMVDEAVQVSNLETGETIPASILYASCNAGKVALPTGSNTSINTLIKTTLATKSVTFEASDPGATNITKSTISGFDVYVITFTGTANSLVIPEFMSVLMPISVDTVISIKDNCVV